MNRILATLLSLTLLLSTVCLSGCGHSSARQVSGEEAWNTPPLTIDFIDDYQNGLEIAAEENKPLLVYFMADDCVFSNRMCQETLTDPIFKKFARGFVCVRINVNKKESAGICKEFKIKGTPTIQFLSPTGTMLQRLTQPQPAKELVVQMQAVLYSVAWNDVKVLY